MKSKLEIHNRGSEPEFPIWDDYRGNIESQGFEIPSKILIRDLFFIGQIPFFWNADGLPQNYQLFENLEWSNRHILAFLLLFRSGNFTDYSQRFSNIENDFLAKRRHYSESKENLLLYFLKKKTQETLSGSEKSRTDRPKYDYRVAILIKELEISSNTNTSAISVRLKYAICPGYTPIGLKGACKLWRTNKSGPKGDKRIEKYLEVKPPSKLPPASFYSFSEYQEGKIIAAVNLDQTSSAKTLVLTIPVDVRLSNFPYEEGKRYVPEEFKLPEAPWVKIVVKIKVDRSGNSSCKILSTPFPSLYLIRGRNDLKPIHRCENNSKAQIRDFMAGEIKDLEHKSLAGPEEFEI